MQSTGFTLVYEMDGTCFNSKQCKKFVLLFQLAHGSGTASVKFLVFINPKGKTIDGTCCRPMVIGLCNPCDQFFEVCLNDPATRLVFIFSPLCIELHGLVQSFTSNVKLEFLHLSRSLNGRLEKSILDHFVALEAHLANPVYKKWCEYA